MRNVTVLKALLAKGTVLLVQISPCKRCAIELVARLVAWKMLLSPRDSPWRQIMAFARLTNAERGGWRYVYRYCVEQARQLVWTITYYEMPDRLDKYLDVQGLPELRQAIAGGRGAILVGAHYGPRLTTFLLRRHGIESRPVVQEGFVDRLNARRTPRFTERRRRAFLSNEMRPLEARKSERQLLKHVTGGNIVSMLIDLPVSGVGGSPVKLFGKTVSLQYFPFKLAKKHNASIFHHSFEYVPGGRYLLRITQAPEFSTPAEGVADYRRQLEERVLRYPYSWGGIRGFIDATADQTG